MGKQSKKNVSNLRKGAKMPMMTGKEYPESLLALNREA